MGSEIVTTIEKYFGRSGTDMHFYGNRQIAEDFVNIFSGGNRIIGDVPDMVILFKDLCLAVEHFEFDSYKNNRGGSEHKRELARVERVLSNSPYSTEGVLTHEEIHGDSSYAQYVTNIQRVFSEHYRRIHEYKKNLINKGFRHSDQSIKMAFLIEDVSPLGSMASSCDGLHPIVLASCKEFLEQMKISPNIDYVLACSGAGSDNIVWFISREELDEYLKKCIDYASMTFLDFTPQILSVKIEIPRT